MKNEEQLWLRMCNLLFEMEQKWVTKSGDGALMRLHRRMMQTIADAGYMVYNPQGEDYDETRTDIEASVCDDASDAGAMRIQTVMKPVVYHKADDNTLLLVQRGAAVVS
ncbi:MAG: hypothetical protein LBP64_01355 [Tannerella sp.]|jgi:hypothetical protein|nr:hypothetical protein [Tannerella sp.]